MFLARASASYGEKMSIRCEMVSLYHDVLLESPEEARGIQSRKQDSKHAGTQCVPQLETAARTVTQIGGQCSSLWW